MSKTYALRIDGRLHEVIPPAVREADLWTVGTAAVEPSEAHPDGVPAGAPVLVYKAGDEIPIAERYHPDFVAQLIEVDPDNLPADDVPDALPPVPVQVVTMRQARLALLAAGILDEVDAAIAAGSREGQIEWEFAATVERDSALAQGLAQALEIDVDALFADAASR